MIESRFPARRTATWLALAATSLLATAGAHAAILFSDTDLIVGSSVIRSVDYSFSVSGPGQLTLTLADITVPGTAWQSSLADLGVSLNNSSDVIGQITGPGQETFDIASAGALYAHVTGEATDPSSGPDYGVGLYNLTVGFVPSAVPLPATIGLLLAALLGLALLQARFHGGGRFLNAPPQSV